MLGMLAGVAGVVLIAVVYYQKTVAPADHPTPHTSPVKPAAATPPPPAATPAEPVR
jgi:hypothetical protein